MNLKQILLEIKNLDIYSPDEWEEYLGYFENIEKILPYFEENISKDCPGTLIERIKNGQDAHSENLNADISPKIISADYLSDPKVRAPITLGVVSGSFDLLHIGHIRGFVFARQFLGQYSNPQLCALTLSDESIRAKKGQNRPVLNLNERLEMLCGVQRVDYVIPLEDPDCLSVLEGIKPDYFFKAKTDTIQDIVRMEMSLVRSEGGKVVFMPQANISTTKLIKIVGGY